MNLLITGSARLEQKQLDEIAKLGHTVYFVQNERDKLPLEYSEIEGVICNSLFQHHEIRRFDKLRYIQLTSAGHDRVPMDYINEQGIVIHNAKDVYSKPMAEFSIGGVLQLYKQSRFFLDNQKKHKWEKHRGLLELSDKLVCIVGCGSVGIECAKRFEAFGCEVIGIGRSARKQEYFKEIFSLERLDGILALADIVVVAVPLTVETYHIFDRKRLEFLKTSAVIVNISRGSVIDTDALLEVLPSLGGAVLDVFEEEPLNEEHPLWDFENVILTPHNSFVGEKNSERLFKAILNNLSQWSISNEAKDSINFGK